MFDTLIHSLNTASCQSLDPAFFTQNEVPQTSDQAYLIQLALLAKRGEHPAGWKVGGQGKEGDPIYAPIGNHHLFQISEAGAQQFYSGAGLELELYFTFNREFKSADIDIADEEVFQSIAHFGIAIEWVESRFLGWPKVNKLLQLADLQNNRALIMGPARSYDASYDFLSPQPRFELQGHSILTGPGNNPVGDPRQLLPWVVRHCCRHQIKLDQHTVITTGSYSGIHFPQAGGQLKASFYGLEKIELNLGE
jgi:2-keto-4-pentenoate hydratase